MVLVCSLRLYFEVRYHCSVYSTDTERGNQHSQQSFGLISTHAIDLIYVLVQMCALHYYQHEQLSVLKHWPFISHLHLIKYVLLAA